MNLNKCKFCGSEPHYDYTSGVYTVYCSEEVLEVCLLNNLEYHVPQVSPWHPDFEDILKNTWNLLNPVKLPEKFYIDDCEVVNLDGSVFIELGNKGVRVTHKPSGEYRECSNRWDYSYLNRDYCIEQLKFDLFSKGIVDIEPSNKEEGWYSGF